MAKQKKPSQAKRADKYVLYQLSVQAPGEEIDFIDEVYRDLRGKKAQILREDFCGTALTACEWVKRRKSNRAVGVDLDPEVLAWGQTHNLDALKPSQKERITLAESDVMTVKANISDIVLAMNFSYWILKERVLLLKYFKSVYKSLTKDGVFFLDAFGGYEAFQELKEKRKVNGFTYVWHQDSYDPISGNMSCHIEFRFPDKSRIKNAFEYHWRLWTLPEIRGLLTEAGFQQPIIYWEACDKHGDGNGEFEAVTHGEADPGWLVYLVAEK